MNSKGFTITEVMISLGIIGVVATAVTGSLLPMISQVQSIELRGVSRSVAARIASHIGNSQSIILSNQNSSLANGALRDCLNPGSLCQANSGNGFYLQNATGDAVISGPSSNPVRYNRSGDLCSNQSQATSQCLFIATTQFSAQCAGGAASCDQADSLSIDYSVTVDPSQVNSGGSILNISPKSGTLFMKRNRAVASLPALSQCPAGEYIREIKIDGSVVCEPFLQGGSQNCPAGQILKTINMDGTITCEEPFVNTQNCQPGEKIVSIDKNGVVTCASNFSQDQNCPLGQQIINIGQDGVVQCGDIIPQNQSCPQGQRVSRIDPSGQVTCEPILAGHSCPGNQIIKSINPDGSAVCGNIFTTSNTCPSGKKVSRIRADGSVVCQNILAAKGGNCGAGKYMKGVRADGSVICRNTPTPSAPPPSGGSGGSGGRDCSITKPSAITVKHGSTRCTSQFLINGGTGGLVGSGGAPITVMQTFLCIDGKLASTGVSCTL